MKATRNAVLNTLEIKIPFQSIPSRRVIQGRGYTLVTIAFADNESSFKLVQKKGRWANSLPHAHVTQPMIQAVIAECFVDGILTI